MNFGGCLAGCADGGAGLAGGVGDADWLDRELAIALAAARPRAFLITDSNAKPGLTRRWIADSAFKASRVRPRYPAGKPASARRSAPVKAGWTMATAVVRG